MTIFGEWVDAVLTFGTDDDLTAEFDIGKDYELMQIIIPTIDSANLNLEVAELTGGTFQALGVGTPVIVAGTGGFSTTIVLGGWQYLKIGTSAGQSANRTFRCRGSRA